MYEPGGVYTPLDVREKDQIPTATQLGQYKSSQAQEGGAKEVKLRQIQHRKRALMG
jgi:hypothetical protein